MFLVRASNRTQSSWFGCNYFGAQHIRHRWSVFHTFRTDKEAPAAPTPANGTRTATMRAAADLRAAALPTRQHTDAPDASFFCATVPGARGGVSERYGSNEHARSTAGWHPAAHPLLAGTQRRFQSQSRAPAQAGIVGGSRAADRRHAGYRRPLSPRRRQATLLSLDGIPHRPGALRQPLQHGTHRGLSR